MASSRGGSLLVGDITRYWQGMVIITGPERPIPLMTPGDWDTVINGYGGSSELTVVVGFTGGAARQILRATARVKA